LLDALPALRNQLLTPGIDPTPVVLAAIDGLYLSLELPWATIAQASQTDYADATIDEDWQTTLTTLANQWLDARINCAYESEATDIAPVFAELFERCLSLTPRPVGSDLQTALNEFVPMPGQVAALLGSAGIYAPLAREIDIAWARSCQQVRTSILTSSSLRSDEELIDTLLATFRTTLGGQLYQPGANTRLIDFAGAGPVAASLYASLMSRQLHMLGQFINPEAYSPG